MKTSEEIKKGLIEAIEETSWVVEGGDAHDLIDACEMAHASMADALAYIQQLESKMPKWISVEERPPEPFVPVLVHMPGEKPHPTVREGYVTRKGKWHACLYDRDPDEVTHWMPLPEAPKEDAHAAD